MKKIIEPLMQEHLLMKWRIQMTFIKRLERLLMHLSPYLVRLSEWIAYAASVITGVLWFIEQVLFSVKYQYDQG